MMLAGEIAIKCAIAAGGESAAGNGGVTIKATVPLTKIPEWAALERQLFDQMEQAIHPYLKKYTHSDGRLVYEPVRSQGICCCLWFLERFLTGV